MKKRISLVSIALLSSCAQLTHGQLQPVKLIDTKNNVYITNCAGAVEDWNSCYSKASATCNGNYSVISSDDNNRGSKRELTFQCKK